MACLTLVQYDEFTVFQDELHVFVSASTATCYTCCRAEHSKQNAGGVLARCWLRNATVRGSTQHGHNFRDSRAAVHLSRQLLQAVQLYAIEGLTPTGRARGLTQDQHLWLTCAAQR